VTQSRSWRNIVELIGLIAVVASLVFVGVQLRQDQQIAVAEIFADHDDTQIEWAGLIAENRDLWMRGLTGEELSLGEKVAFNAIASAYFSKEWDRYMRAILISGVPPKGVALTFANTVYSYPSLHQAWQEDMVSGTAYWDSRRDTHSEAFRDWIESVEGTIRDIESGLQPHLEHRTFAPM
jgi:hypothetical protein